MKKFYSLILVLFFLTANLTAQVAGMLDVTFNTTGKSSVDVAGYDDAMAIAKQVDGKYVLAGRCNTEYNMAVVRLNEDGSPDVTFNTTGKLILSVNAANYKEQLEGIAIQSDGKIIVVGQYYNGTNADVYVARLNPDGSFDNTFNGNGRRMFPIGSGSDYATCVDVNSITGKIIVGGTYANGSYSDCFVVQFNSDGTFDTGFDTDGIYTTSVCSQTDFLKKIKYMSTGKIIATGHGNDGFTYTDLMLLSLNDNGTLNTGFNSTGKLITSVHTGSDYGNGMCLQSDGKIMVVGSAYYGQNYAIAARFNTNGTYDNTFNSTGKWIGTTTSNYFKSVCQQPDGKLVIGGDDWTNYYLWRFNANGSPDLTFGTSGVFALDMGGPNDFIYDVLMDGWRIVTAGAGNSNFGATRHLACISPVVTTDIADADACIGVSKTFTVNCSGSGPFTYEWFWEGTPVGSNSNTLTIPSPNLGDAGNYQCTITNLCGTTSTSVAYLSVNAKPTVSVLPGTTNNVCVGTPFQLDGNPNGGTPPYVTHSWTGTISNLSSSSIQEPIFTATAAGVTNMNYSVTDSKGCSANQNISITASALPVAFTVTGGGTMCEGDAGVSVCLSASSNGIQYELYRDGAPLGLYWTGNGGVICWTVQTAGVYTVMATNTTTLCSRMMNSSKTVIVNPAPESYAVSGGGDYCAGHSGNTITLAESQVNVNYQLNLGATPVGSLITGTGSAMDWYGISTPGNYNIVATNANSCTASMSNEITVTSIPLATVSITPVAESFCQYSTVTLNGNPSGGSGAFTMHSWSGDIGSLSATDLQEVAFNTSIPGVYNYMYTVSDTYGCSSSGSKTITVLPTPTANAGADGDYCYGSEITLSASASGGKAIYTYYWSDGVFQNIPFIVTTSNTYTVTVIAQNGCSSTDDVNVNVLSLPNAYAGSDVDICQNGNVTLSASGGDSYSWSTGATTADINVTPGSTTSYIVTAMFASGCTDKDTVVVNVEAIPVVDAGNAQSLCANNATATLVGSVLNASGGMWTGGNGSYGNSGLLATTYTPTSTEIANGSVILTLHSDGSLVCNSESDQVTLSFTPTPVVNAGSDQSICESEFPIELSGSVTVALGGVWTGGNGTYSPNYTSLITSYTPSALEMQNGYVTLTLTSSENGNCIAVSNDVTFELYPMPIVNAGSNQSVCSDNPEIDLNATVENALGGLWTGGTGSFSPNNTSLSVTYTPSLQEITNGFVTLTLTSTGSVNCGSSNDQITIFINSTPTVNVVNIVDLTCYNTCNGQAQVVGIGGSSPYDYLWSTSAGSSSNALATNLCSGNHSVTVTDDNGCVATTEITIDQPTQLTVSIASVTSNNCFGGNNGVINTSVIGGVDPYIYHWSNGANTANAFGLVAGTYSVTVIDDNGCYAVQSNIVVGQPQQMQVYVNTTNAMCNQSDGTATATVVGGTGPFDILWSNSTTDNPATDLYAGTYSVIVTDFNNCMATRFFSVSNNGGFTLAANVVDVACAGGNNGSVDLTITGGTVPFDIEWSNGAITQDVTNLQAGAYDVIVTDDAGCMGMETYTIEDGTLLSYTSVVENPTCNQTDGSITITPGSGTAPFTFIWSNGGNSSALTGLAAGTYIFTVTDVTGCSISNQISLANTGGPVIEVDTLIAASCGGQGSAMINVTGGTAPYEFEWSNSSLLEDLQNVAPGLYDVTVSDDVNCISVGHFEIPVVELPLQPICIVTVDTTAGRNLVVWEKVTETGVDFYKVYRETSIPDQYQAIGIVDGDAMSEYLDMAANPFVRSFRYKVSAVDMCGNETPLSNYHKTLHLTMNQGIGTSYNLIWDDYEGFTYYSFIIMRYLPTTGWLNLDTLPKTLHSYSDLPPATNGIKYLVRIDSPSACSPTSASKEVGGPYSSSFSNMEDEGVLVGLNQTLVDYSLSLYPNPSTGFVTIGVDAIKNSSITVQIMSVTGQQVYSQNHFINGSLSLNLSHLNKGIYFVELKGDKVYRGKLVIE